MGPRGNGLGAGAPRRTGRRAGVAALAARGGRRVAHVVLGARRTTGRILEAVQRPGTGWKRLGVAIDAGFAGDSDLYGVESPSVVHTPGGYLMAYGGFDGETTQLHMATSADGQAWTPQGTIMQRGPQDALGASHPCLGSTEAGWWLFYSGYDGSQDS